MQFSKSFSDAARKHWITEGVKSGLQSFMFEISHWKIFHLSSPFKNNSLHNVRDSNIVKIFKLCTESYFYMWCLNIIKVFHDWNKFWQIKIL